MPKENDHSSKVCGIKRTRRYININIVMLIRHGVNRSLRISLCLIRLVEMHKS
jgi:hypothetical protein